MYCGGRWLLWAACVMRPPSWMMMQNWWSHMRFMRKCAPAFMSEGSWDVMSIIWVRNYVLSMCMSSFQLQISLMTKHHNLMTEHYQFQSKSSETLGIGLWHCHCHQLLFAKPCCNELLLLHYVFIFWGLCVGFEARFQSKPKLLT